MAKRYMIINMEDLDVIDLSKKGAKKAQTGHRTECTRLTSSGMPGCVFDSLEDKNRELGMLVARDPSARFGVFECVGIAEPAQANFNMSEGCVDVTPEKGTEGGE